MFYRYFYATKPIYVDNSIITSSLQSPHTPYPPHPPHPPHLPTSPSPHLPISPSLHFGRDTEVGNIFLNSTRRSWGESGVI